MVSRSRSIVALLAGALGVVACGGSSAGGQRVTISLRHFAEQTSAAGTARFSVKVTNDDTTQGGPEDQQSGSFDFKNLTGSIQYPGAALDGGAMTAIVAGGAAFIPMKGVGEIDKSDPCYGKKWGVFDYPKYVREHLTGDLSQVSPLPFDPGAVVTSLQRSDATLTAVGTDVVRGSPTTHYSVAVDTARLDRRFASDEWDDRTLKSLDIWVDGTQRLARARWVLTIRWGSAKSSTSTLPPGLTLPADIGGTYNETTTTDVWDYGVSVNVTRPADSATCDFPDFFQRTMDTFDKP